LKINTARFLKSGASARHYPDLSLPEIAFAGRSNVGKSSLINTLVNRKKLARTSATPGKTQMLNFFLINDTWVFVDLPGYGYARVPEAVRASWGPMVEAYLMERKFLRLVVLILDIRRDPSEQDLSLLAWLRFYNRAHVIALSKADKLSRGVRRRRAGEIRAALELGSDETVVPFSARTGEGKDALWGLIRKTLAEAGLQEVPAGPGEDPK